MRTKRCGLYIAADVDSDTLYIGKSKDIDKRGISHANPGKKGKTTKRNIISSKEIPCDDVEKAEKAFVRYAKDTGVPLSNKILYGNWEDIPENSDNLGRGLSWH